MTKIVILGCNGGTDIAYGGGAQVVASIAKCLSERGFQVHLVSLIGLNNDELSAVHHVKLNERVYTYYKYHASNRVKIPHVMALMYVNKYLNKVINYIKPDLIIFNDDIPRSIYEFSSRLKIPSILYVHFSYIVRRRLGLNFMYKTTEWSFYEALINYLLVEKELQDVDVADYVVTNSLMTLRSLSMFYKVNKASVLYPPVNANPHKDIKKRMVFLHAARQDRTFLEKDLVRFIIKVSQSLRNSIFIVNRNKSRRIAKISENNGRVYAFNYVPNNMWNKVLDYTKYYLHFKWFEGLGLTTLQAIMNGALPIAYRSEFNGTWTDIASVCGAYCGFRNTDEAIDKVLELESNEELFRKLQSKVLTHVINIASYDVFCDNLMRIVNEFL